MSDYQRQMAENHRGANYEWAYRCNPIVGCSGVGCECRDICWAKGMFNRMHCNADGSLNAWKRNNSFEEVQFYPKALDQLKCKTPRFYLNGMGDPFDDKSSLSGSCTNHSGEYWDVWEYIRLCLIANPQSNLVLLTKKPQNIPADLPDIPNLWVGISSSGADSCAEREEIFIENVNYPRKVISLEPIARPLHYSIVTEINWLIVGGLSRGSHKQTLDHVGRGGVAVVKNMIKTCQDLGIPVFTKSNLYEQNGKRFPGWEDFAPLKEWPESP